MVQTDDQHNIINSGFDYTLQESSKRLAGIIKDNFPAEAIGFEPPNNQVWEQKIIVLSYEQYISLVTIANRIQDHELHELVGKMQGKP